MTSRLLSPAWALALGAAAACVTTTTQMTSEFGVRPGWQECVGTRLAALGYRVQGADTLSTEVRAAGDGGATIRVAAAAADPPQVRLRAEGVAARAGVDSVLVHCALARPVGPDGTP